MRLQPVFTSTASLGLFMSPGLRLHTKRSLAILLSAAVGSLALGCGGDESDESTSEAGDGRVSQQPEAAADPSSTDFPDPDGRTLEQLAKEATPGPEFANATSTYVPGENRVAFGLVSSEGQFIYAPTAVYVGRSPTSPARGPYLAPADSLVTDPAYQSRNAATEDDAIASVYAANVELPGAGPWSALILSDTPEAGLIGATAQFQVSDSDAIPAVGGPAPPTDTDTVDETGDIARIDTRVPPDTMHETELTEVLGEKPVALLFATPQLCQSRVCGPVTDIAEQLKTEYGDRVEFIHQEVYVDNDPNKGLREPLRDYNLETEPWLFTIDADGKVAARLEGSFGVSQFEEAVQEALQ